MTTTAAAAPAGSSRRRAAWRAAGFAALFALSLLPRWPYLANATLTFTADEAVDALGTKRAVERGEWRLFHWDTRYYGVLEGLGTLPLVPWLGFRPLTFKLGALLWAWAASLGLWRLARRRYGELAAWTAAALPLFVSGQLLYWSLLAAGGYLLVVAWGAFALDQADRLASPSPAARTGRRALVPAFLLGAWLGLGLYAYRLFVVVLAALAVWALERALSAGFAAARERRRAWLAGGAGFALGLVPVAIGVATAPAVGREPSLGLAAAPQIAANLRLLLAECLPALLGARPVAAPWRDVVGDPLVALQALSILAGWSALAAACLPRLARPFSSRLGPWPLEALVALLPLVNAALFLASRSPADVLSNRYLLPSLISFALGAAWLVSRVGQRSRAAAVALAVALVVPGVLGALRAPFQSGLATRGEGIVRRPEPLLAVLDELERRGVRHAYAPYWVAYRAAFLSGERLIADATDWSRFAPYARAVDADPRAAWIFSVDPPAMDAIRKAQAAAALERFEARLAAAGALDRAERIDRPHYRVFLPRPGEDRLLPPPARQTPRPLAAEELRGSLELLALPAAVAPGASFTVAVRLTNLAPTGAAWLAEGDALRAGRWQVNLGTRWLRADGSVAIEYGPRTPLPADLPPATPRDLRVVAQAPDAPGDYRLRVTLVQEDVAWFDQAAGTLVEAPVSVREPG